MNDIRVASSVKVTKSLYPLMEGTGMWQESVWMNSSGSIGPLSDGGYGNCLLAFKTRFPDARIWKGARDSCLEAFWYDCNFGNMRKAGGCDVTDTSVPERNFVLIGCKVRFCNAEIDAKVKEGACSTESWR